MLGLVWWGGNRSQIKARSHCVWLGLDQAELQLQNHVGVEADCVRSLLPLTRGCICIHVAVDAMIFHKPELVRPCNPAVGILQIFYYFMNKQAETRRRKILIKGHTTHSGVRTRPSFLNLETFAAPFHYRSNNLPWLIKKKKTTQRQNASSPKRFRMS